MCSTCFGACMSYCLCWHPHQHVCNLQHHKLLDLCMFVPLSSSPSPSPCSTLHFPAFKSITADTAAYFCGECCVQVHEGLGKLARKQGHVPIYPLGTEEGMQHKWRKYLRWLSSHTIQRVIFVGGNFHEKLKKPPRIHFRLPFPLRSPNWTKSHLYL